MKIRIDKWISDSSEYSRKEVKNFFKYNKIKLNGEVVKKSGMIVDTDNDMVALLEKEIIYEEKIYIMMNKPSGYISSAIVEGEKTIMELLDSKYQRRLFPIGRLDKDTEGLILLTNDGQYSHKLMHPNKKVSKIYYVEVDNDLEEKFIDIFSSGVDIGDYFTKPATLKIINKTTCTLEIQEGKFHQVKRMFEAVGCKVIYLKRIQIGKLELDKNLKNGEYRKLNQEETEKALIGN